MSVDERPNRRVIIPTEDERRMEALIFSLIASAALGMGYLIGMRAEARRERKRTQEMFDRAARDYRAN